MPTEADTCRKFVVPALQRAGWDNAPFSFLVNDPKDKTFAPFGDARHKIENGTAVFSREIHDGKQLSAVKLTDYTAEKVRSLCANPEELSARWTDLAQRAEIIEALNDRGIDFPSVALQAGKPDADPFDLLCHLAFNAPVLTRRQRAERVKREEGEEGEFFGQFGPDAREILGELLEKYAQDGELQFTLPDV